MTLAEWLDRREPAPPESLRHWIERLLGDRLSSPAADAPSMLLGVARDRLRTIVRSGSTGRDVAFDLLTVDALVTYAFQAAAEHPASLAALAQQSFTQLSEIAPS